MIKDVYLIFKTHLDVGFTDLSENVIQTYLHDFIPRAMQVSYALKGSDTEYIWTVGAWLLDLALKQDRDGRIEQAIQDGCFSWHALPFTTHTEMMNPRAFQMSLKLSERLDRRFGVKTTAAKLSDVPGHTIGIVPLLRQAGVDLLHIGVNPASPMPPVLRWKCGTDSIVVMYNEDYGTFMELEEFAVGFGFTGDNNGPASVEEVKECYRMVRQQYPGAAVHAATLNDIAALVRSMDLPVVEQEIGDTWIHGIATDPRKLAGYRALLRQIDKFEGKDITQDLMLVPEHTWGLNMSVWFHDKDNWRLHDFERVHTKERDLAERSWYEQRSYVKKAAEKIGFDLDAELQTEWPDFTGCIQAEPTCTFRISFQLFDRTDYERYQRCYLRPDIFKNRKDSWAIPDFTKLGLPYYQGGITEAVCHEAWCRDDTTLYLLSFPAEVKEEQGLPELIAIQRPGFLEIRWFGKKANRLPQAFWLKFTGLKENWKLHKMGQWIAAKDVVGSPLISAVNQGVSNGEVKIIPIDSALVAPFGRRLLEYGVVQPSQDLYFNLYNNIWNTNFPMWYSDDSRFRFQILKNMGENLQEIKADQPE